MITLNGEISPAPPRPSYKHSRKLMSLPAPTHRLIGRVALLRGMTMSDALYAVFRDELRRQDGGDARAFVPSPFSVKPIYLETECAVLLWNPFLPDVLLTGREACSLADALRAASDGTPQADFKLTTKVNGRQIKLSWGGSHVSLHVDDDSFPMVRLVAADVALALEAASAETGSIPGAGLV